MPEHESDIQFLAALIRRASNQGVIPVTSEERHRLEELVEHGRSITPARIDGQLSYGGGEAV